MNYFLTLLTTNTAARILFFLLLTLVLAGCDPYCFRGE